MDTEREGARMKPAEQSLSKSKRFRVQNRFRHRERGSQDETSRTKQIREI